MIRNLLDMYVEKQLH